MGLQKLLVTNQLSDIQMSTPKGKGLLSYPLMKKFINFFWSRRLLAARRSNRLPLSSEDVSGDLNGIFYRSSPPSLR